MNQVIVVGGNHHNTLAILRSLGEKSIKSKLIVITGDKKPFVSYSKYISSCIVLSSYDGIKDAMFKLKTDKEKPVVIACSDIVSSYLDQNRDELSQHFILPCADIQGRITTLMDKDTMAHLAVECGIIIPKSWVVDTKNYDVEQFDYPCIIKPLASIEGSKTDIYICENKEELAKRISEVKCQKVQIQKFIDKDIEFQLIGCSLNGGETVIIPGASVILRYSGLFSLEFLRGKDGRDYFMEINFRNDGNSICVTASGMNLPYIWYLYNCGLSYSEELCYDKMKEVIVMPEFDDFANVKNRTISLWHWLKDIKRTDRFMEFSKYDQKPFWQKLKILILIHLGILKQNMFN